MNAKIAAAMIPGLAEESPPHEISPVHPGGSSYPRDVRNKPSESDRIRWLNKFHERALAEKIELLREDVHGDHNGDRSEARRQEEQEHGRFPQTSTEKACPAGVQDDVDERDKGMTMLLIFGRMKVLLIVASPDMMVESLGNS
jgi:hypothetical protein